MKIDLGKAMFFFVMAYNCISNDNCGSMGDMQNFKTYF